MKERLHYLDTQKGILIILVIIGHVIQSNIEQYQDVFLFRFIYSFHMPLFFFISGFLTFRKTAHSQLISKRACQCLIPFITWALLTPAIKTGSFNMQETLLTLLYPNNGLWFLYNLFIYCVAIALSEYWSTMRIKQELWLAGIAMLLFAVSGWLHTILNATPLSWYFPFFAMGYYVHKYQEQIFKHSKTILLISGICYVITVPFWMMREVPTFYQWINLGSIFAYVYRYSVSVAGTLFFFMTAKVYFDRPYSLLEKIGTKTLGIYIFQFVILYILENTCFSSNLFVETAFQIVVCFFVSLAIVILIQRIKYLRLLLIGSR